MILNSYYEGLRSMIHLAHQLRKKQNTRNQNTVTDYLNTQSNASSS